MQSMQRASFKLTSPLNGDVNLKEALFSHRNSCSSLSKLQSGGQGGNPRVCDVHWGACLYKLLVFDKHHYDARGVSDGHWGKCLCKMHFFGEHYNPGVCDRHWGRCLCTLQILGEHHYSSVSDGHCGLCLCRLQIRNLQRHSPQWPLGKVPFSVASLCQASLSLIL